MIIIQANAEDEEAQTISNYLDLVRIAVVVDLAIWLVEVLAGERDTVVPFWKQNQKSLRFDINCQIKTFTVQSPGSLHCCFKSSFEAKNNLVFAALQVAVGKKVEKAAC